MTQAARAHIGLAELLGVLSFGADLGMGQPMEHVLRQCLISLRLAERMGLDEADREVVYYTSLLVWVGCHVDAYEQAKWFGDEMALKSDFRHTDFGAVAAQPLFILRYLGAGRPMAERALLGAAFAWSMTWGGSACRTPSGTSPARSATRKPSAFGFILT